ncbi:MAG TPA: ferrous iron transport protein B [Moorella mulderi]|nr:ferrous iron transport protein B [Moorella mulderi]
MGATVKSRPEIQTIALAGNLNVGKTCIFNALTGARQYVGNWPGVTVEKKEGRLIHEGRTYHVIDLPGTYSLSAYSEDEVIARNYILFDKPHVVINVVDATNLERNLYLTTLLLEMGANVVMALNMMDEAQQRNIEIDPNRLSQLLGIPVVPTVATRNQGIKELIARAVERMAAPSPAPLKIDYGKDIEGEIEKLQELIEKTPVIKDRYPSRWLALKLLEGDRRVIEEIKEIKWDKNAEKILIQAEESRRYLSELLGDDPETLIVDRRYGFIAGLVREAVKKKPGVEKRLTLSDKIDAIVTHRYLGLPIFLVAMWAVFELTFRLAEPLSEWLEEAFGWLGEASAGWLASMGAPEILASFVKDGLFGGVGAVLVFIPPIFLLFFFISLLEDSGYMARGAYVMDRIMHSFGLHGKSFIPMLLGFGCNVPAIMATRTLENRSDRMITILINPLMSCMARLPVYLLFAMTFFPEHTGIVVFSLYLLGILLAILMGRLFRALFFKGEVAPFVMELPPYRMPTAKSVLIHMWDRGSAFIRKAGTIILAVVILVWALANLPVGVEYASEESWLGQLGSVFAPLFQPAGFGHWQAAVALITGILAKEAVVGTLGAVYGVGEEKAHVGILESGHWTPLSAYAFLVMTLIYIPCVATIAVIRRETNSWKWTAFAVAYTLVLGWITAVLIYQVGRLLGFS